MNRFGWLTLVLALLALTSCKGKEKEKERKPAPPVVVVMNTSMGTVEIELYPDKTPLTVKNFLAYVDDRFYDNTIFHRVMEDFMIQGGGFLPGLKEKENKKPPIKLEAKNGLDNERGTIAMARADQPDSATSQFFINVADNSEKLGPGGNDEYGYCAFGKVIKGMDVVDKIRAVKTGQTLAQIKVQGVVHKVPYKNVPVKDVIIKSIRRASTKAEKKVETKEQKKEDEQEKPEEN